MAVKNKEYYLRKMEAKDIDLENIKRSFEFESKLKSVITVQPAAELATMEYYNNIPGVTVDQDVQKFWNEQQTQLDSIQTKITTEYESKYLSSYEKIKNWEEILAKQAERMSGANNPNKRLKELYKERHQIQKNEIGQITNRADLGIAFLEMFTGFGNEETRKITDPFKHLKSINEQIKAAKERIDEQNSTQNEFEAKIEKEKLNMLNVIKEVDNLKVNASLINSNSIESQTKLKEQYKVIDKYMAIKNFKNSNYYNASMEMLNLRNPELAKDIKNLPSDIPDGLLKISLTNPLDLSRLPVGAEKIEEINEKINKIKDKLPTDVKQYINIDDISSEIQMYSLRPEELSKDNINNTIRALRDEKANIDSMGYSNDERAKKVCQLDMKLKHLELQSKVYEAENDINQTINEINSMSPSAPNLKRKYNELEAKKGRLNILKEKLEKDTYTKTIDGLNEIQKLVDEKAKMGIPENVSKIGKISDGLSQQFEIRINNIPLSVKFVELIQEFSNNRKAWVEDKVPKEKDEEKPLLPYGKFKDPHSRNNNSQSNDSQNNDSQGNNSPDRDDEDDGR